jgi:Flp pilus assembly pilin Flp
MLASFIESEDGATAIEYGLIAAIEYGLIAAMIAVALIAAFVVFGDALLGLFGYVRDRSGDAMNSADL